MLNTSWFEKLIIRAITILLMFTIAVATLWLCFLFAVNTYDRLSSVRDAMALQEVVQQALGGVFVVLLGLELLETLKTYATKHRFRLEVVLVVGAIAVARHIVQLDFRRADGAYLAGLGGLIAALVIGYCFVQRIPEAKGGSRPAEPGGM
jgi:uncharacterized membrane protein (DUF373 family)